MTGKGDPLGIMQASLDTTIGVGDENCEIKPAIPVLKIDLMPHPVRGVDIG